MDQTSVALCIDLDGTLVRSDLLLESALTALKGRPFAALAAILRLGQGRAQLKQRLAELADVRVDLLPYNPAVVALAETAKAAGRPVVLATASNRKYAEQVALHLGLFDAVQGSDATTNLCAQVKAERLVQVYGEGGFDYAGDSRNDLAVWCHARRAIVVNPAPGLLSDLTRRGVRHEVLGRREAPWAHLIRALRAHQWLKNALVFLPLLTAHLLLDARALLGAVAAFLAFSFMASAGYVINDLLDLDADRRHSRKRLRPFACGALSVTRGLVFAAALAVGASVVAALLPPLFLAVLYAYLVVTLAYSLHLKRRMTLDVLTLAGLYTLRVIGGAAATGIPLSFWLLAFSMFLFLGLAYLKRYAELESLRRHGGDWVSGRGYGIKDLDLVRSLGIPAGYGAVLVLALYINSPEVRVLYSHPQVIWLICPLLLYWTARTWSIAHRGLMHDDPLIFAITDRGSQAALLMCALILFFAR